MDRRGRPSPATTDRLSVASLRRRFPALDREINGHRLVYLDTAATALKLDTVIDAQADHYRTSGANAHRGLHRLADEATTAYEQARHRLARWVGAPRPEGVVFSRSTTAALNLVARGIEPSLRPGDEVLLTEMEHHANLVPWIQLAARTGVQLRHLPVTDDGELDLGQLPRLLTPRTKVVSLTYVSNVLGTINPVAAVAEAAHRQGALVVVDAAQAVGHLPVDFGQLGADLMVFSAHKAYGPMGLGFLVGTEEALERLAPLEGGGQMIREVHLDRASWAELPLRLEAGTPDVASATAFVAAVELLDQLGLDQVQTRDQALTGYAIERLGRLGGLRLLGPADPERRGALVSFVDPRVHPHDLATVLDEQGVAVRAGHHCAQPLHRKLGVPATTRASFGIYSDRDDVDALVEGIEVAARF
ncbi:MAG: SufS family cysteine desulfurase, partial [Deltaproteobacteria bacterium]|nr:SufS family cysteine desulfurase [Deltaproteobacteria bacterium]